MKAIFSDFDGTLTSQGKLGALFFDILNICHQNHAQFIVCSGRSLSWGHFLLTHFSMEYAIMEGGGVILSRKDNKLIQEELLVSEEELCKLQEFVKRLQKEFPKAILSPDSFGRKTDRALEIFYMDGVMVSEIEALMQESQINYSRSNVHLNFWSGDVSKYKATMHLLKKYLPQIDEEETIFYGDSTNDESMFQFFTNTVGVSNIFTILDQLKYKPKIILEGKDFSGPLGVFAHLKEIFDSTVDF
jgi:HAD superfamily hydrolase (TIGR01484 family)